MANTDWHSQVLKSLLSKKNNSTVFKYCPKITLKSSTNTSIKIMDSQVIPQDMR